MKAELALRWVARSLSAALAALLVVFAVGEGPPPLFTVSVAALESWLLVAALVGLLAAWRYEFWGAIAGLAGIGGFTLVDFAASGFHRFPGGWVFPVFALIPVAYLLAWWLHRAADRPAATDSAGRND